MAQHNLIRFQLSKRKLTSISLKKLLGKLKNISLKKLLGKNNIQSLEDVGDDLKDLIFQHLLDMLEIKNIGMNFTHSFQKIINIGMNQFYSFQKIT